MVTHGARLLAIGSAWSFIHEQGNTLPPIDQVRIMRGASSQHRSMGDQQAGKIPSGRTFSGDGERVTQSPEFPLPMSGPP